MRLRARAMSVYSMHWWASAGHRTAGAIQHSLVGLPFSSLFGLVFSCLHGNLVQFGNGDTVGARSVHMIRCPVYLLTYLSYFVGIIWAIQSLFHSELQAPCPGWVVSLLWWQVMAWSLQYGVSFSCWGFFIRFCCSKVAKQRASVSNSATGANC